MIDRRTQLKLSSKINQIMKDCVYKEDGNDGSDIALLRGYSAQTKDVIYQYSISKAERYIPELLELCRMLPKIKTRSEKFSFIISYADLITELTSPDAQKKGFIVADHFINLLNLSGVGLSDEFTANGKQISYAMINSKYKDQISS